MFDAILGSIGPLLIKWNFIAADKIPDWLNGLSLGKVFGWIFSPVAFLMGVAAEDVGKVGSLLGSKLSINEHYAYLQMRQLLPVLDPTTHAVVTPGQISERSFLLTAFALTGFANFSSVGIQLGGIGAIAPNRRHDLARLGMRALFVGFTATLLNASIAGILLPSSTDAASPPAATAVPAAQIKPFQPAMPFQRRAIRAHLLPIKRHRKHQPQAAAHRPARPPLRRQMLRKARAVALQLQAVQLLTEMLSAAVRPIAKRDQVRAPPRSAYCCEKIAGC